MEAANRDKILAAKYENQLVEMRKQADVRRKDEVNAVEAAMTTQIQVQPLNGLFLLSFAPWQKFMFKPIATSRSSGLTCNI